VRSARLVLRIALLTCLLAPAAAGQEVDDTTSQIWLDYADHFYLNRIWEFYNELGYRLEPEDGSWQEFLLRPSMRLHSSLKPYEGRFGADVRWSDTEHLPSVLELRPWAGGILKWPALPRARLTLNHFARIEWRLLWRDDTWDVQSVGRFRYKLGTKIALSRERIAGYFFVPLGIEWFVDLDDPARERFASRVRPEIGLGYVIDTVWVAEAHFYGQNSRAFGDDRFDTTQYIFRFQVKRLWSARDYLSRE